MNWGIEPELWIDPSTSTWDNKDNGIVVLDDKFDPSTPDNQVRLNEICKILNGTEDFIWLDCFFLYFEHYAMEFNGEFPVPQDQFHTLVGKIALEKNQLMAKTLGFIDGKLVFFSAKFKILGYQLLDRQQRTAFKKRMDDLMADINDLSLPGLNQGHVTAWDNWPWLDFRGNLIKDGINGACLTLLFAFLILLVTTLNLIVSTLSILCIASIII